MRMFEYMNECQRVNIKKVMKWLDSIDCKYLIVLHDKDEREPHYHCFVKLVADRDIEDVARQLNTEIQFINYVNKWKNALAYAFHLTENAKNDGKYIYNEEAVVNSKGVDIDAIFERAKEYESQKKREDLLKEYLYKYGNCEISKKEMLSYMTAQDYDKFAKSFKKMQEYRIMKVRDRQMTVVYITGGAGAGKTTLAKFMATTQNYDYFVSGSGKDVLDGYDKEECIILDDLRADVFTKAELFKLTDNNTNSSVKSRFRNKDISYCKLMVITSVKDPFSLYNWSTIDPSDKDETFNQFARRIGNKFLWIDANNGLIYECAYDTNNYDARTTKVRAPFTMAEVFQVLGIKAYIGNDIFSQIIDKVKDRVEKEKEGKLQDDDLPF